MCIESGSKGAKKIKEYCTKKQSLTPYSVGPRKKKEQVEKLE